MQANRPDLRDEALGLGLTWTAMPAHPQMYLQQLQRPALEGSWGHISHNRPEAWFEVACGRV